ncbi:hypothetical protein, partial [Pseudomonas avellanae]|uniref:hypothetical protein n=2 Tax=Pseudomonas TaxID=286 RepID=UPI001C5578FD
AALRKSDAIRAELAKATTLDTQPRRRVKGYVSRGQGHHSVCTDASHPPLSHGFHLGTRLGLRVALYGSLSKGEFRFGVKGRLSKP